MIKKIGNWSDAEKMFANIKVDIQSANEVALKQIGLKGERYVVKVIQSQPSSWPALSDKYRAWKKKKGYSSLMLLRTKDMFNRITSMADKKQVFIGLKREAVNREGESLANIAAIMEFGSKKRNIPARPFLMPAHQQLVNEGLDKLFQELFMKECKRKYKFDQPL